MPRHDPFFDPRIDGMGAPANISQALVEPDRRALLSAIFGIFAFIDVPLVFGAIRWWRTQHPQPVIMGGQGSGLDPTMKTVFFFSALAMHVFMLWLIAERYTLEKMQTETDFLAREAEAQ